MAAGAQISDGERNFDASIALGTMVNSIRGPAFVRPIGA